MSWPLVPNTLTAEQFAERIDRPVDERREERLYVYAVRQADGTCREVQTFDPGPLKEAGGRYLRTIIVERRRKGVRCA